MVLGHCPVEEVAKKEVCERFGAERGEQGGGTMRHCKGFVFGCKITVTLLSQKIINWVFFQNVFKI